MKFTLMLVGRTVDPALSALLQDYVQRVTHYAPFTAEIIPDLRATRHLTQDQQRHEEGKQILSRLLPNDHLILLDEHGKMRTSTEFAAWMQKQLNHSAKRTVFLIGGAYGFSPEIRQRANASMSLSPMTFPHQLVRVIFAEQLYRAFTILHNQPYHHE